MSLLSEIFKFDENYLKFNFLMKNNLGGKIDLCFEHLFKNQRIPINKLRADNTFDFKKLKNREAKNYDWFFLANDNVRILVRQYQSHFTFFSKVKHEGPRAFLFEKINIFTISVNTENIDNEELKDSLWDNPLITLDELLPKLVDFMLEDKVYFLWGNPFAGLDYVEVEVAYTGGDIVSKLDSLLFACGEISQMFLECYAENEMLAHIKTLKTGDKFGDKYTVKEVRVEVEDDYYHDAGLVYTKQHHNGEIEEDWSDVYSLTRFMFDDLMKGKNVE